MKTLTRFAAVAGLVVTSGLLVAPTASATPYSALQSAHAANFATTDTPASCTVTGGSMNWGVKESFRSYISSTIANGAWDVQGGASYETPRFGWSGATGQFDPSDSSGSVSFPGGVIFTGHNDILRLTMTNPTLEFSADGTARLLVDVTSNDTSGVLQIEELQAELGTVSIPTPVVAETATVTFTDAPVTMTEVGEPTFANFYRAGDALDPITVSFDLDCVAATSGADAGADEANDEEVAIMPISADVKESEFPWMFVGVGAAAVVVIGAVTGALVAKRRKASSTASTLPTDSSNSGA